MLQATTTRDDRRRASRLLLAWIDGDRLALDVVLAEADAVPAGLPGLLFELVNYGAHVGLALTPDLPDQLRGSLLRDQATGQEADPDDQDQA